MLQLFNVNIRRGFCSLSMSSNTVTLREILTDDFLNRSWAAERETTRVEDMAYCLFGLFDVNLPLIYGEGAKAFIRLQEAIALSTSDLSMFAWTSKDNKQQYRGILALSPREFLSCGSLLANDLPLAPLPKIGISNRGSELRASLINIPSEGHFISLRCHDSRRGSHTLVTIRLVKTSRGYARYLPNRITSSNHE